MERGVLGGRFVLALALALLACPVSPTLAATHAGEILGVGSGSSGELGPGTVAESNTSPVEVALPGMTGSVTGLAAGDRFSFVATSVGQFFGFGEDVDGEAGLPGFATLQPPLAVPLPGASSAPSLLGAGIVTGFAATATGQLYSWGNNEGGMLGRGAGNEKRVESGAVTLPGASGGVAAIAAGDDFTLVATASGQLYSFGRNKFGELGRSTNAGTTNPNPTPALVPVTGPVKQVAAGEGFGLALTAGGNLYTFGLDDVGQLGTGEPPEPNENPNPTPQLVTFPAGAGPVTQIAAGEVTAYALTASGRLFGWGEGFEHDQLGFEEANPVWTPREIVLPGASAPIVRIGSGEESAYALTANGVVFGWGGNENGELGEGQTSKFVNPTPTPVTLPPGTTVDTITSGCCSKHLLMLVADLSAGGALPGATTGTAYAATIPFSGGTAPYAFAASGLPAGLAIDPSTGAITGTPTQSGTFAPAVTVRDVFGIVASGTASLVVSAKATSPLISLATQIRIAMLSALGLHGKAAKITRILAHGYAVKLHALEAGKATIQWFFVPKGAHVSAKKKHKPVLVASGSQRFSAPGTKTLTIKLTSAGRKMLEHARRVKLTAKGTFAPAGGGKPISVVKGLSLSR